MQHAHRADQGDDRLRLRERVGETVGEAAQERAAGS